MKKILIISFRFHTNLYYRAIALQNAGSIVKIFVLYKGKSEFYENIDIKEFKLANWVEFISKIIKFFKKNYLKTQLEYRFQIPNNEFNRALKKYNPDVILLKSYQELFAINVLLITRKMKAKIFMLTQTDKAHIKGIKKLFSFNIYVFKKLGVKGYITPIKSNLIAFRNFKIQNIYYVPFIYPINLYKNTQNNTDVIKIISVGKYQKRKDHILLIKAVENLSNKHNIKLNIYGEKSDLEYFKYLNNYILSKNLQNKIFLNSNIGYQQLCEKYKENDVFVLPSYQEPAAYSIVEAMSYALPVVCSSECGTQCYIKNGENGYVFKAKNILDLQEKVSLIISDRKKLYEMSKKALSLSKQNHNPENYNNQISKILNEVIKYS